MHPEGWSNYRRPPHLPPHLCGSTEQESSSQFRHSLQIVLWCVAGCPPTSSGKHTEFRNAILVLVIERAKEKVQDEMHWHKYKSNMVLYYYYHLTYIILCDNQYPFLRETRTCHDHEKWLRHITSYQNILCDCLVNLLFNQKGVHACAIQSWFPSRRS